MEIKHIRIVRHTRNYVDMLAFYRDSLGMKVTRAWDEPHNRGTLLAFREKIGQLEIEILEWGEEAVPGARPVNVDLSIEVDNADAWHTELLQREIMVMRGPENMPWGHRRFGVDDPDGLRIWFYQVI